MVLNSRALIIVNGGRETPDEVRAWHHDCHKTIAVDGGAQLVLKAGIVPDIVVGDFDSIDPELLRALSKSDVRHLPEQNTTDFQKALRLAVEIGADNIVVLDPEGDRLDHALSALGWASVVATDHRKIRFAMSTAIVHLVRGDFRTESQPGGIVSILPLGSAHVSRTVGLKWELSEQRLEVGVMDSVSNISTGSSFSLHIREGCAAVFVQRFPGDTRW